MARFLFTLLPLIGHLNPALAVAATLLERGHQVAWAVHTAEIGASLPEGAHVYTLASGPAAPASPPVRGLRSVQLFFEDYAFPLAERALPDLVAAVQDFRPDVMAVDCQMVAGAIAARRLGVPWGSLACTSAAILKAAPPVHAWIAAQHEALQRRCLPLPAATAPWPDLSPHRVVVFSIDALVGRRHERFDAPFAFVGPMQAVGRRPVAFPWDWLRADAPTLLVTLGTVSRDLETRFFEVVLEALAGMPAVQAVMVAPQRLAAQAPPNVLVQSFVPQPELLARVDGVVCHAGHNTVCEALLRGLPLVVSPIRDDQPVIARQVVDAGAGLFLRHGKATPAAAREAIERVLGSTALREGARRLAQQLQAAPGRAGAADALAALVA